MEDEHGAGEQVWAAGLMARENVPAMAQPCLLSLVIFKSDHSAQDILAGVEIQH